MTENNELKFHGEAEAVVGHLLEQLFGLHTVAYFTDACRIMYSPGQWAAGSHLVAHLVRELESMVRAGLLPLAYKRDADENSEHCKQIAAIADSLGLAPDSPVTLAWTNLDLHRQAHRAGRGFSPPRPIDDSFKDWWQDMLRWLRELLEACRDRHLEMTMPLEQLVRKDAPSHGDADKLMERLSQNPLVMGRILSKIQDGRWLPMLRKRGLFDHVPRPEEMRGWWPPAILLDRLSRTNSRVVSETLTSIEWPNNAFVVRSYLEATSNLSATDMFGLASKVVKSLGAIEGIDDSDALVRIIDTLATHGYADKALIIFNAASRFLKQPDSDTIRAVTDPASIFEDGYWFAELVTRSRIPLTTVAPKDFLKIMAKRLEELISRAASAFKTEDGPEYLIHHYREDVAEDPKDPFAAELNAIISVCRDTMVDALDSGALDSHDLATFAGANSCRVIDRAFMVAMAHTEKDCRDDARRYLMDRTCFEDKYQEKEYARLAGRYFGSLNPCEKATFIDWSKSLPSWHKDSGDPVWKSQWQAVWTLRKLRPVRNHLSDREREHLDTLEAKHGTVLDRTDHEHHIRTAWVRGPLDATELAKLDVVEALEFVSHWQPTEATPFYVDREGLLGSFRNAVGEVPDKYVQSLASFESAPFEIRVHVLSGIVTGVRNKKPVDWETLLDGCHWLTSGATQAEEGENPDHKAEQKATWARQEMVALMELGISSETQPIPDARLQEVWDIIKPLLRDSDPSLEREAERQSPWGAYAYHIAINSVAGVAWQAATELLQRALQMQPAMSDLATSILHEAKDYAENRARWRLGIHAMLGGLFFLLLKVDRAGAVALRPHVFPTDTSDGEYFDAAWEGLIRQWNLRTVNFDLLRKECAHAIDRLAAPDHQGDDALTTDEHFAIDLISRYCSATIDYGEPDHLMERFESSASPTVFAAVMSGLGRTKLDSISEAERKEWARRALDLVDRRLATHEDRRTMAVCEKELRSLVRWLGNPLYEPVEVLNHLKRLIGMVGHAPRHSRIIEELVRHVPSYPEAVLTIIERMVEGKIEPWEFGLRIEELNQSLHAIQDVGDHYLRDRVRVVVNRLSAHGIRLDGWEYLSGG